MVIEDLAVSSDPTSLSAQLVIEANNSSIEIARIFHSSGPVADVLIFNPHRRFVYGGGMTMEKARSKCPMFSV